MKKRKHSKPRVRRTKAQVRTARLLGGHEHGLLLLWMNDRVLPDVLPWEIAEDGSVRSTKATSGGTWNAYAIMDETLMDRLAYCRATPDSQVQPAPICEIKPFEIREEPKPKRRAKRCGR